MFQSRFTFLSASFFLFLLASCDRIIIPPPVWNTTPVALVVPPGFAQPLLPADNPLTEEGIKLGRMLFYDPILSADSTQACAGCHAQEFFWDGRQGSLEDQAFQPVINPIEMHDDWDNVVFKLQNHPDYPAMFRDAFGDVPITSGLVTGAIAQFERTFKSANSRFDKIRLNDPTADFTQSEFNGYVLFFTEKGDCFHCHQEDLLTDHKFHNNGVDSAFSGVSAGWFKRKIHYTG